MDTHMYDAFTCIVLVHVYYSDLFVYFSREEERRPMQMLIAITYFSFFHVFSLFVKFCTMNMYTLIINKRKSSVFCKEQWHFV